MRRRRKCQASVLLTDQERDAETGLDYFGARYYDPWVGRFMSVDPAFVSHQPSSMFIRAHFDSQAVNVYSAMLNRPTTLVDPDGREPNSFMRQAADWADSKSFGMPANDMLDRAEGAADSAVESLVEAVTGGNDTPGSWDNPPFSFDEDGNMVDKDGNKLPGTGEREGLTEEKGDPKDVPIGPEDPSKTKKGSLFELIADTLGNWFKQNPFMFTGGVEVQIPVGAPGGAPSNLPEGHVECIPINGGC